MRRSAPILTYLALASSALLALTIYGASACDSGAQASDGPAERPAPLRVELDERAVLVGEVVERLEGEAYVYLRLSIIEDSAAPQLRPHTRLRWVAVEGEAPGLGARVHARSLAHRSRVWEPALERDFEEIDYVALLASELEGPGW